MGFHSGLTRGVTRNYWKYWEILGSGYVNSLQEVVGGVAVVLGGFLFEDLGLGYGGKEKPNDRLRAIFKFLQAI